MAWKISAFFFLTEIVTSSRGAPSLHFPAFLQPLRANEFTTSRTPSKRHLWSKALHRNDNDSELLNFRTCSKKLIARNARKQLVLILLFSLEYIFVFCLITKLVRQNTVVLSEQPRVRNENNILRVFKHKQKPRVCCCNVPVYQTGVTY